MRTGAILLGLVLLGATPIWGQTVTLQVSTFTPDPGETVQLWISGAPVGAEFLWDLNGDGIADSTTEIPRLQWAVPQGAHKVRVVVKHEGKVIAAIEALIVADPYIACWQTIIPSGNTWEVKVTFRAKANLSAPGLEIEVPEGWGVEVSDPGNLTYKIKGGIHGFWAIELYPGDELGFRYRLYPVSPGLSFVFSGKASGVVAGRYYTVPIAGVVAP